MLETVAISAIIVALAVLIHFEMLRQLSRIIPKMATMLRFRVLCALFGALIAHIVEVQLFAMGYYAMTHFPWPDMVNFGTVVNSAGEATVTLRDCSYFSFVSYTTLGFGEIIPVGHISLSERSRGPHRPGAGCMDSIIYVRRNGKLLAQNIARYENPQLLVGRYVVINTLLPCCTGLSS